VAVGVDHVVAVRVAGSVSHGSQPPPNLTRMSTFGQLSEVSAAAGGR
jgi:hypothetical protein